MATKVCVHRLIPRAILVRKQQHLYQRFYRAQRYLCSTRNLSSNPSLLSSSQVLMETITQSFDDDQSDGMCTITKVTLNRPKANAMGREMIGTLEECLDILENSNTLQSGRTEIGASSRCVVLTSFSEKVFSAGADLKERATMTQDEAADFVTLLRNTMERFASLPMPVIAAIQGVAVGGGLELALAADIRIASENAILGLPETSLAIIPGAGGTQRLPRLIGEARAKELIWTGRKLNGNEAKEYGLVTDVVPSGESVTQHAVDMAFRVAANGPVAIRASKEAIQRGRERTCMKEALEIERQCYAKTLPTQDRLEGLQAFKEGRRPQYKGR